MAYKHGVYTSEIETSVQVAQPVDSALPFVVGTAPRNVGPVLVTSWSRFCELFGVSSSVDIGGAEYQAGGTLTNFAYYWFLLAGRGECFMQSLPGIKYTSDVVSVKVGANTVQARFDIQLGNVAAANRDGWRESITSSSLGISWDSGNSKYVATFGDFDSVALSDTDYIAPVSITESAGNVLTISLVDASTGAAITSASLVDNSTPLSVSFHAYGNFAENDAQIIAAIQSIHTIYERFGRVASLLLAPTVAGLSPASVNAAMVAAVQNIGGRFKGVALLDCDSGSFGSGGHSGYSYSDVAEHKPSDSPFAYLTWPHVGVGSLRFPGSVAICASINAVDGQYGGLPYVAQSNKPLPITGEYWVYEDDDTAELVEEPVWLTRDEVNTYLGAHGITSFRHTAQGWVSWGVNTAAFPGSTDVKDYLFPIRRMFNHVSNQFQIFADARVDMPLNRRQLEGVVKSFNQVLSGWVGFGALNAASISLDDERNTEASLLSGAVYFRIRIAPPPPMVVIEGVLEYDVAGFSASLA